MTIDEYMIIKAIIHLEDKYATEITNNIHYTMEEKRIRLQKNDIGAKELIERVLTP